MKYTKHQKEIIFIYKEDCLSLSVCLDAFAQFSIYRAATLQAGRGRPGTGRGGVKIVGVLLRGTWGAGRDRSWMV